LPFFVNIIDEIVAVNRPQDVVIFIVGGTTYEESRSVALYNAANPGVRFFLGGCVVLNSKRYRIFTMFSLRFFISMMYTYFFLLGGGHVPLFGGIYH
jgi:hypothetical protein